MNATRALAVIGALCIFAGCRTLHVTVDGVAVDAQGAPTGLRLGLRLSSEDHRASVKASRDKHVAGLTPLASATARIGIMWAGAKEPASVRTVTLPCSLDLDDALDRDLDDFLGVWIQVDAPGYDSVAEDASVDLGGLGLRWRGSHYDLAFAAFMKRHAR